jgi:hypothetical protein
MTKSDLKNGMIVKTRDGGEYVVVKYCLGRFQEIRDVLLSVNNGWIDFDRYDDDLNCLENSDFDVMEVCAIGYGRILSINKAGVNTLLWKRQNKKETTKELTLDEIEEQLGYKVKIVNKEDNVK